MWGVVLLLAIIALVGLAAIWDDAAELRRRRELADARADLIRALQQERGEA